MENIYEDLQNKLMDAALDYMQEVTTIEETLALIKGLLEETRL
jgi:hypothetical protein